MVRFAHHGRSRRRVHVMHYNLTTLVLAFNLLKRWFLLWKILIDVESKIRVIMKALNDQSEIID